VIAVGALAMTPGCSSSKVTPPSKTVPVSGTVMLKGRPASGIRVKFHPQFDIGRTKFIPSGETDANGKFRLSTGALFNGAPQGEYLVTIEMPRIGDDPKDGLEAEIDQLKGAYADPAKSEWKITIIDGDNVLEPFQLK
jgi:hypothetical protein